MDLSLAEPSCTGEEFAQGSWQARSDVGKFARNYGAAARTCWWSLIVLMLVGCGQTPQKPTEVFHEEHPATESGKEKGHEERNQREKERRQERREAKRESERSGDTCRPSHTSAIIPSSAGAISGGAGGAHDLQRDEQLGGHTLRKHVGRTDDQLRERLEQEPHISAASTWTNSALAEETVAAALRDQAARISQWGARGERRPNLALHYDAGRDIGRSLPRGASETVPCTRAVIVLKANGENGFYVLTTYPEAGR
jgi:hypothetical protein